MKEIDITGLLPKNWVQKITVACQKHAQHVIVHGKGPGSLESDETAGLDYSVVDGVQVKQSLPWMYKLYCNQIKTLAEEYCGNPLAIATNTRISININILEGLDSRYEKHLDSFPVTAMLFVTDHNEDDGGRLVLEMEDATMALIPTRGNLVIFEGNKIPHYVENLRKNITRITMPMVYNFINTDDSVSNDLENYMYGS
jgi:hypothetical protein